LASNQGVGSSNLPGRANKIKKGVIYNPFSKSRIFVKNYNLQLAHMMNMHLDIQKML